MKSFWVLVSGLFFAIMGVFVKLGSDDFSSAELVFYRSAVGIAVTAGVLGTRRIGVRTAFLRDHVTRGTLGCVGLVLYFYIMSILPLAMAVTLNHTAPIFFALIAAGLLGERLGGRAVAAIGLGFAGVVLLLRPSADAMQAWGSLVGLVVGVLVAIGYLYIRKLGEHGEPESRTVFYYSLICTIVAGVWTGLTGVHPVTMGNAWILVGVGVSATVAQLALTRAYKRGKSVLTTTLTYSNVVFASIFGVVIWNQLLPPLSWLAILLIVASGILSTAAAFTRKPSPELPVPVPGAAR